MAPNSNSRMSRSSRPGPVKKTWSAFSFLRLKSRKIRFKSSPTEEDGQAIVEIAIALPVVATFLFTMIEICLAFYSYCMISESAREASRYAIVHGATCLTATNASCTASSTAINNYVTQTGWPNLGAGQIAATTTFLDGNQNPGSRVQVKVTYIFPVTLPFVPKNSISMASNSIMYIVQ